MIPVQPYHQFKFHVAKELEKKWLTLANGIELVNKHGDIVDQYWQMNKTPVQTAMLVDFVQVNRDMKIKYVSPLKLALNYDRWFCEIADQIDSNK